MNPDSHRNATLTLGALALCAVAAPLIARDPIAKGIVIQLPNDDRALIEQYLGQGVVGDAIEALPIDDPTSYIDVTHDQTERVKRVSGDDAGTISNVEISVLDRPGRVAWKLRTPNEVLFGELDGSGSLVQHSSQDLTQSVLSRYSPPEPMLTKGMAPGASVKSDIQVAVYDLSNTSQETHSGQLALTYTYVGAYKVTVPAGTYDTVLFKWDYDGKVGPASVKDVQYWFYAKGVGPVAMINRQDVSAFLIYNKDTKGGDVLLKHVDDGK